MFVSVVKYTGPFCLCFALFWAVLVQPLLVSACEQFGKAICVFIQGQTTHIVSCHTLCIQMCLSHVTQFKRLTKQLPHTLQSWDVLHALQILQTQNYI